MTDVRRHHLQSDITLGEIYTKLSTHSNDELMGIIRQLNKAEDYNSTVLEIINKLKYENISNLKYNPIIDHGYFDLNRMNFLYTNLENKETNPLILLFPKTSKSLFETLCNEDDTQQHLKYPIFRAMLKNSLKNDGIFEDDYIKTYTNNLDFEHFKNIQVGGENVQRLQDVIKKIDNYENIDYILMYAFFTDTPFNSLDCRHIITRYDYVQLYNSIITNINKPFKVDICVYAIKQYLKSFPMARTYQLTYDEKTNEIVYTNQGTMDELKYEKLIKIINYAKKVIMMCWPVKDFDILKTVLNLAPFGFDDLVYFETLSCNSTEYIDVSFLMKCLWYVNLNDNCNCSEIYYILSKTAPIMEQSAKETILRFAIFESGKLTFRMPYKRETIDEILDEMEQFGAELDFYFKIKEFEAIQYYHDTKPSSMRFLNLCSLYELSPFTNINGRNLISKMNLNKLGKFVNIKCSDFRCEYPDYNLPDQLDVENKLDYLILKKYVEC